MIEPTADKRLLVQDSLQILSQTFLTKRFGLRLWWTNKPAAVINNVRAKTAIAITSITGITVLFWQNLKSLVLSLRLQI